MFRNSDDNFKGSPDTCIGVWLGARVVQENSLMGQ